MEDVQAMTQVERIMIEGLIGRRNALTEAFQRTMAPLVNDEALIFAAIADRLGVTVDDLKSGYEINAETWTTRKLPVPEVPEEVPAAEPAIEAPTAEKTA